VWICQKKKKKKEKKKDKLIQEWAISLSSKSGTKIFSLRGGPNLKKKKKNTWMVPPLLIKLFQFLQIILKKEIRYHL
jgi:hypothetical protein